MLQLLTCLDSLGRLSSKPHILVHLPCCCKCACHLIVIGPSGSDAWHVRFLPLSLPSSVSLSFAVSLLLWAFSWVCLSWLKLQWPSLYLLSLPLRFTFEFEWDVPARIDSLSPSQNFRWCHSLYILISLPSMMELLALYPSSFSSHLSLSAYSLLAQRVSASSTRSSISSSLLGPTNATASSSDHLSWSCSKSKCSPMTHSKTLWWQTGTAS